MQVLRTVPLLTCRWGGRSVLVVLAHDGMSLPCRI